MLKISVGSGNALGVVQNVNVKWSKIVETLTKHVVGNKGERFFIGGYFSGTERKGESLVARTLLTIDIDDAGMTLDDIELQLAMVIDCAAVAYSTHSHTNDRPRIRLVMPLSREVTPDEYRALSTSFCADLGIPVDICSFKPNQLMYTPSAASDDSDIWVWQQDGEPYQVPDTIDGLTITDVQIDDLSAILAAQPLDIAPTEVDSYLLAYPAHGLDYDAWVKVGMALYHQFQGSKDGFNRWVEWSGQDAERFDKSIMPSKWKSFGGSSNPVTFATIIHHVKAQGGVSAVPDFYEALLKEASDIVTFEEYNTFKAKICAMSDTVLPPVHRSGIVSEVADGFGKLFKIAKGAITKELAAVKRQHKQTAEVPSWLEGWVYVENICQFAHADVPDYSIKREAFNAKYDRQPDCVAAEKQASQLALVNYQIDTVVDTMFFPPAGKFFEYEGKQMMNSFTPKGVEPCDVIDEDGQKVVDLYLKHLEFTLEDKAEQDIFLSWNAYLYQNQGKRIGWAMLLQGAQGTGKSYFGNVLQELMGTNVRSLDTQAISGRFTGWAHGSLVTVVEEIRIAGTNKYEILDKLKPIISNSTIQIEEKGRDHRTVPNFTSYFLLTNHKDAVPLMDGDRRYCCLFSRVQSEEQLFEELGGKVGARDYFDTLFAETLRRPDALARFLLDYKIPKSFDPLGRAPDTLARQEMKALSVSPERDAIVDAISTHACEIISDDLIDVTYMLRCIVLDGEEVPKTRTLSTILSELGYSPIMGRRVKCVGRKDHYVWMKGVQSAGAILEAKNKVRAFHSTDFDEKIPF